jgi:hypothetical protein
MKYRASNSEGAAHTKQPSLLFLNKSELNNSAARMGLTDIEMNVGGVSIPIL